ncbi:hypothetical protein CRG98_009679 [Punica granatum]|uniref:Uncharacterized protein n=1 Tax=Punica granatum TaxID=22663 RepID=A0A2I0KMU6_PUNGR|nr:hypothetical protein CRG98_009679 [Punica granatum]
MAVGTAEEMAEVGSRNCGIRICEAAGASSASELEQLNKRTRHRESEEIVEAWWRVRGPMGWVSAHSGLAFAQGPKSGLPFARVWA